MSTEKRIEPKLSTDGQVRLESGNKPESKPKSEKVVLTETRKVKRDIEYNIHLEFSELNQVVLDHEVGIQNVEKEIKGINRS